jgi:hypothetical protein
LNQRIKESKNQRIKESKTEEYQETLKQRREYGDHQGQWVRFQFHSHASSYINRADPIPYLVSDCMEHPWSHAITHHASTVLTPSSYLVSDCMEYHGLTPSHTSGHRCATHMHARMQSHSPTQPYTTTALNPTSYPV